MTGQFKNNPGPMKMYAMKKNMSSGVLNFLCHFSYSLGMATTRFYSLIFLFIFVKEKCTFPGFVFGNWKICLNVDFYDYTTDPVGIGRYCSLTGFNCLYFFIILKGLDDCT